MRVDSGVYQPKPDNRHIKTKRAMALKIRVSEVLYLTPGRGPFV